MNRVEVIRLIDKVRSMHRIPTRIGLSAEHWKGMDPKGDHKAVQYQDRHGSVLIYRNDILPEKGWMVIDSTGAVVDLSDDAFDVGVS